jgi:hypothetical protein
MTGARPRHPCSRRPPPDARPAAATGARAMRLLRLSGRYSSLSPADAMRFLRAVGLVRRLGCWGRGQARGMEGHATGLAAPAGCLGSDAPG